jgi:hypothetical protein
MKFKIQWIAVAVCAIAALASTISVGAQSSEQEKRAVEVAVQAEGGHLRMPFFGQAAGGAGDTFVFVGSEMGFDRKLVKGAPYSAQAVTETVQMLGDGNRIVRRDSSNVYRDGEGRTRREHTFKALGSYVASGEPRQTIFIYDPVANVSYILNPSDRTARKLPTVFRGEMKGGETVTITSGSGNVVTSSSGSDEVVVRTLPRKKSAGAVGGGVAMAGPIPPGPRVMRHEAIDEKNINKESLGKQVIEGVEAEGTRLTRTIPAGEIGNEQPINIVSEMWYSSELQVVVMSRHSDPRFGETTYKLTGISRSEPARTLFEVPSDYTVNDTIPPGMQFKIETELKEGERMRKKHQM